MTNMTRPQTLFQSGAEGVYAVGSLHMATKPTANDTVIIGGITYTFKASAAVAGEVTIGAAVANSQANLKAAVNGTASPNTSPNPFAAMATFAGNDALVTARVAGPAGNTVTTTATLAAGAPDQWNAATLGTSTAGAMSRGTSAAATSRLVFPVEFDADDALERTPYATGLVWQNRGYEQPVMRGTKFTIPEHPINYETFPILGLWGFNGAVIPTAAGVAGPFTWPFTPSNIADPNVQARTLQRRMSDGTNTIDDGWAYGMLDELAVKWQQRRLVTVSAKGFARARSAPTFTAAQVPPTTLTQVPAALVTVFCDDTWGALGGTQITGQIVSGEMNFAFGMKPEETADGRTTLDFTKYVFDPEARKFTFKVRAFITNSGFAIAERTKAEAGTYRAVRVKFTDATTSQSITFDMIVKHTKASEVQKMVDVNGQEAVDLEFEQSTDNAAVPASAHVLAISAVSTTYADS